MAAYFSIILVIATLVTGLIALADKKIWSLQREEKKRAKQEASAVELSEEDLDSYAPEPAWVETSKSIFPVIALVLVLRSFLYEPFQIPSGSMMPTLLEGDFVLVEKFSYGLKDPAFRFKFLPTGEPERGDIAVFKYPEDTRVDYIKRIVGLPGDKIFYHNKSLYIQEKCEKRNIDCPPIKKVPLEFVRKGEYQQDTMPLEEYIEQLGEVTHSVLINPALRDNVYDYRPTPKQSMWQVPEGQYFVLGDNRDNSRDGRYWGFVHDEHLVGKAVAIWMSFEKGRSADSMLPQWFPTGIRFNRIGGIE